jgi:cytochrome c-type biogenesis protein CcmH/NrfG
MIGEISKLMLRAYNAEADNCVRTLRPHTLASSMARLDQARATIARLGKTMSIEIGDAYHRERLAELELTADYLVMQEEEEEKDRIRTQRELQREEEAARRGYERENSVVLCALGGRGQFGARWSWCEA